MRRHGERVGSIALGIADIGRQTPMRSDTLLPWFSATKPITALAVLQLWERGRVMLDDPVAQHVPEFAQHGKHAVTIRHVLTHTAGLHATTGGDVARAELAPGWVPGERAAYDASSAFLVLGEIVRRVDGRAFDDYVSEEIFEPLDMADSWLALTPERYQSYVDKRRMGVMYETASAATRANPTPRRGHGDGRAYLRPMATGSGVGPMRDLVRFWEALGRGGELDGQRIVSPQTVEAMLARHRSGMEDETFRMVIDWGLGVLVNSFHYRGRPTSYGFGKHASRRAAGHGGSQSSIAFVDPEHGLAVALCCNGMPGEAANHRRTQPVLTALYEDLGLARGGRP